LFGPGVFPFKRFGSFRAHPKLKGPRIFSLFPDFSGTHLGRIVFQPFPINGTPLFERRFQPFNNTTVLRENFDKPPN